MSGLRCSGSRCGGERPGIADLHPEPGARVRRMRGSSLRPDCRGGRGRPGKHRDPSFAALHPRNHSLSRRTGPPPAPEGRHPFANQGLNLGPGSDPTGGDVTADTVQQEYQARIPSMFIEWACPGPATTARRGSGRRCRWRTSKRRQLRPRWCWVMLDTEGRGVPREAGSRSSFRLPR